MKKVLLINLILIIICLAALELFCINVKRLEDNYGNNYKYTFINYLKKEMSFYKKIFSFEYYDKNQFRKPELTGSTHTIILIGCSFTYGKALRDDETFSYKLSKYTGYNVYNFGIDGASPREMLYIAQKMQANKINADYVIYTFITDQKPRLYSRVYRYASPAFVLGNDGKTLKYSRLNSLLENISRFNYYIRRYFAYKKHKNESFKLFCSYMLEINREIKRKISDKTQFIILVYNDDAYDFTENSVYVKRLKAAGINIIKLPDIINTNLNSVEYQVAPNDFHPNAKAWDIVVPVLVEQLKLPTT